MKAKVRLEEGIRDDHVALRVAERTTGKRDENICFVEIAGKRARCLGAIGGWSYWIA